jgi:hypothetical protein
MKPLIMQFSPPSHHFISLQSKYAPQHPQICNRFILFQDVASKAEAERMTMYRCIIASIIESETAYLECLNVMIQVCH